MKKFILISFVLVFNVCTVAFSQISVPTITNKKVQIGLNAGTMFGVGGGFNLFSTYLQPTLSYQLRPKWHFQTGLLLFNQQFSLPMMNGEVPSQRNSFQSALWTAGLAYDVNEKLQVSGMVYSNLNQQAINSFNQRNWGMMFNATYKISDNVRIQGTINISNGRNPMWSNAFGNPMLFQNSNHLSGFRNGIW